MPCSYFHSTRKPPKQVGLGKHRTFPWSGRDPSSLTLLPLMYPNTWCHDNLPPTSSTSSDTSQLKVSPPPPPPHECHERRTASAGWHQVRRDIKNAGRFLIISLLQTPMNFKSIVARFLTKLTAALASHTVSQIHSGGSRSRKPSFERIPNQGETEMHV